MSMTLVRELVARLAPLIDRDICRMMLDFTVDMYQEADGYCDLHIWEAIDWWLPGITGVAGPRNPFSDLPAWDDLEEWESIRRHLGDFPLVRTYHYFGSLGAIGWDAAEALGITDWLDRAVEYPAAPRPGSGGPLGWYDPAGGPWDRPGLGIVYEHGVVEGLEITLEEARGCYLWMVTILSILLEAWDRLSELRALADADPLDWSDLEDASPLERARVALPASDAVLAGLREGRVPKLDGAEEWFEELKLVIAATAIIPEEVRAVQTKYDAGLLLRGHFRDALDLDALVKAGLADDLNDLLRDMEWSLIEVRPWIERLPEPGSPAAIVQLVRWWEIPSTPQWLVWQAVYGDDEIPIDPYSIRL